MKLLSSFDEGSQQPRPEALSVSTTLQAISGVVQLAETRAQVGLAGPRCRWAWLSPFLTGSGGLFWGPATCPAPPRELGLKVQSPNFSGNLQTGETFHPHCRNFVQKGGKKTKALHPLASKRIFLLCETGREKGLRFFLLCLIDINMKYSSVVLIRLGFPARVRGKLFWIRIFLAKIFCLNPPCSPPLPALASKAQQCVLGCCTHTPQPPPLHGRLAGWPARSAEPGSYFFQKQHLAPWQSHKQLCWQQGWPGSVVFRLLPGSHPQTPCSLSTSGNLPALPRPSPPPHKGGGSSEHPSTFGPRDLPEI